MTNQVRSGTGDVNESATAERRIRVRGWEARAAALADQLTEDAVLTDPARTKVFTTTPRHVFIPRYWDLDQYNSPATVIDGTDPEQRARWLDAVYSDRFLITQWVGDVFAGNPIRVVTSSASQPCTVAAMLERLALADGHRVLEIGTGTGYNAALLCARLGDGLVTSVDIDPNLVAEATTALAEAGYRPQLHATDGGANLPALMREQGWFDRIIATCSVERIPPVWIELLAPGGRLVAPLSFGGGLAVLDKTSDGLLEGGIDPYTVYFMPLRSQTDQAKPSVIAPTYPADDPEPHQGTTDLCHPQDLDEPDFQLWLALHLPGVHFSPSYHNGERTEITIYTRSQKATCRLEPDSQGLRAVIQHHGRIWDTVETAWHTWNRLHRPTRDRLRLSVHPDGNQCVGLDTSRGCYRWPLPTSGPT
jgi:protein-L-isoaspartate O-methyltransferase